ncbi:MAG: hypothetical protein C0482_29505 [Gordonia sp.]|nr:hypothetical protein [Gordonia sp. (in: high G+C Gram-positive bacteria)]
MSTTTIYTELDALTVAAPNLAAVKLTAVLRDISFQQAMIAQTREWAAALDEAIDRHAQEAAINIGHAEHLAATAQQRKAWHTEAAEHLAEVTRLSEQRIVAARMLIDADANPVEHGPHHPQ